MIYRYVHLVGCFDHEILTTVCTSTLNKTIILQKFSDHLPDGSFDLCRACGSTDNEMSPSVLVLSTVLLVGAWLPWIIRRHCDYAPYKYDEQVWSQIDF